ncbi:MAG: ribosome-associated translation inhibitor RaiA [Planctomycetes bacterium]|nr:ribosome-associated translation inhibitor RaiA [Planctomycetota bacterium]
MNVEVTLRHIDNPPLNFKSYIEDKIAGLGKYGTVIDKVSAIASDEHSHDLNKRYRMELVVRSRGQEFVAKSDGPNLMVATDTVMERISKQIVKHKERRRERH